MFQLIGRGPIAVPHQVGVPDNTVHGLLLVQFAPDPAPPGHTPFKPSKYKLRLVIGGDVGANLIAMLWCRDGEGWSIPGETGNLGVIGGQQIGLGTFTFPLEDMGMYEEILVQPIQPANNAVITAATLTSVLERGR